MGSRDGSGKVSGSMKLGHQTGGLWEMDYGTERALIRDLRSGDLLQFWWVVGFPTAIEAFYSGSVQSSVRMSPL